MAPAARRDQSVKATRERAKAIAAESARICAESKAVRAECTAALRATNAMLAKPAGDRSRAA